MQTIIVINGDSEQANKLAAAIALLEFDGMYLTIDFSTLTRLQLFNKLDYVKNRTVNFAILNVPRETDLLYIVGAISDFQNVIITTLSEFIYLGVLNKTAQLITTKNIQL